MLTSIMRETAEVLGFRKLKPFGIDPERWEYNKKKTDREDLNLGELDAGKRASLRELLTAHADAHGVGVLLRDLDTWEAALADPANVKSRTVRQAAAILAQYLLRVPGHRVYERKPDGTRFAYYIHRVVYHPPYTDRGSTYPAYIELGRSWRALGIGQSGMLSVLQEHIQGLAAPGILAKLGYEAETPGLRAEYEAHHARFSEIMAVVGRQYLATGIGTTGLDDIMEGESFSDSDWRTERVDLVRGGNPTRVVVDVFHEKPDKNSERDRSEESHSFWDQLARDTKLSRIDSSILDEDDADLDTDTEPAEIPVHPLVPVFDLSKHVRIKVHAANLAEYRYDPTIIDKLILPPDTKSLVRVLVEHEESRFRDVVEGKSGGAVVLLSGPAGTGKTLTSEVYAESEGRALYSVQCSQLGIEPADVERRLMIAFERARRWGAVMLLDEADVYVRSRGSDLTQNAIVGVFLRVLEYQSNVLFLTTNRPDDVDDAIMSRCVARISYRAPSDDNQARIWRALADSAGIPIDDATIAVIVLENPGISGRDVKQLLKLAQVVRGSEPITPAAVSFVRRFRPSLKDPEPAPLTPEEVAVSQRLHRKVAEPVPGTSRFRIRRKPAG